MKLNTASSAISFGKKLEDDSAKVYEDLARKRPEIKDTFLYFVRENGQNKILVDRTYYGAITDALEGCFSFEGLDTNDYMIETEPVEDVSYADRLKAAIAMEETIMRFYSAAAETSRSLLQDVARAFEKVAKKRGERIQKLKSLLCAD